MSEMAGKWGYAMCKFDETWHGAFSTPEAAARELLSGSQVDHGYVGQYRSPARLSEWIDADRFIEDLVCNHEDYIGDYAEESYSVPKEMISELTDRLQAACKQWETDHGIGPTFGIIDLDTIRKVERTESEDDRERS